MKLVMLMLMVVIRRTNASMRMGITTATLTMP